MNRRILRLALPNILSNISVPLLSSVDTLLMGHLSAAHLAALGISGMVFMFLYANFGFLRMGTTGMVAQAYGARDGHLLSRTLYRAMTLAIVLGLLLILFQGPLWWIAARLMHIDPPYGELATRYFLIRIWSAPAVMILYVLMGFFFGMQNARYPLYVTLVVNLINLLLSVLLVRGFELGIVGVAWGTVAAQYGGVALALYLLRRYRRQLYGASRKEIMEPSALAHFFRINRNIFLRTVALTFALAFFYAQASAAGERTLAVMVVLMQFLIWMSFAEDGFANAAESLVGRYYGASQWGNFTRAVRLSLTWGAVLALIFSLFYALAGSWMVGLYTRDEALRHMATGYLPWVVALPPLSFAAFIFDGIFIGMTAVKAMRDAVFASLGIYLGVYYLLRTVVDPATALWIGFVSFFFARGALQAWMFLRRGRGLR